MWPVSYVHVQFNSSPLYFWGAVAVCNNFVNCLLFLCRLHSWRSVLIPLWLSALTPLLVLLMVVTEWCMTSRWKTFTQQQQHIPCPLWWRLRHLIPVGPTQPAAEEHRYLMSQLKSQYSLFQHSLHRKTSNAATHRFFKVASAPGSWYLNWSLWSIIAWASAINLIILPVT